MTPERWQQVKELFRRALECEPSQRTAFLREACPDDLALRDEVESLIASHEKPGPFMEASALEVIGRQLPGKSDGVALPRRIGAYQVIRELGRGGMGAVHLAVRADDEFRKQVAIKTIKRGMDTDAILCRFRQERQILADLDHPNIARLLDGGTTEDGLSYFIMDYVEGLPIDVYCDTHKLSITDRLKLFRTVCSAVQYAHQHRIVHRDLKPSNILMTADGAPKLLDFGIAKVLDPGPFTGTLEPSLTALRPMTPQYASPEQVNGGDVTPVSDVYSLGVLLYELLTGHRPYHVRSHTPQEVERVVCEEEPEKPSAAVARVAAVPGADGPGRPGLTPESVSATREGTPEKLRRRLAGDLDKIVLMALRKEPARRYASVAEFSEDIGRHLEGQPVIARRNTLGYRTWKVIRRNRAGVLAAAVIIGLVMALIGVSIYTLPRRTGVTGTAVASLAVLPLENFSQDPNQEYFADGMTEALIADLAQVKALRVISRTSVMPYKGVRKPLAEIAQALKVDAVIEGSVQRAGDRVRVTVQLIEVASDRHLWAQSYERDVRDVLALQSEVARAITQEIQVQLTPQERSRLATARPVDPEAFDAYLKGRSLFWDLKARENLGRSAEHFQQAIRKDPRYARAHAALAECYALMGGREDLPPRQIFPQVEAAAREALRIDDQLAEAHNALGAVQMLYLWDLRGAERAFQRAIELNPGYANAHNWYGNLLAATGRREAAIAEHQRALELDPHSLRIHCDLAFAYFYTGQYDETIAKARKVLARNPNLGYAHNLLARAYTQKGMYEEALAELQRAPGPASVRALALLGYIYAVSGKRQEAERVRDGLKARSEQRYVSPYQIAVVYAGLGEKEQALEWLYKAYEGRAQGLAWLKVDIRFQSLRSDPRFTDLVRRIGLPP